MEVCSLYVIALLFLLQICMTVSRPSDVTDFTADAATCGYESCNPVKEGMINVHIVPHTHDDVGWLKTVDQYFYGDHNDIQTAGVQYILDSVIPELQKDPTRRFIYVEIAFFARWWREQDDSMRHVVKGLVKEGRLEFILGGWCMNDEASTHYNAIIDQHALGLEFLRTNFGECGRPRIAWQIDPFGHSREQASLFAQMGYDGLYFGRLDYADKDRRLNHTTMEMLWRGSPKNIGARADLFTGALPNMYQPPPGFCFDALCTDPPVMDDERLHDYNVPDRVAAFLKAVHDQAQHYQTDHIIMTMGSDFQYSNAHTWFKNLDKLMKYVNNQQTANNSKVNVLYSTPSCYTYRLNQADKTWTTKEDDFFPYGDGPHAYWTGYFSSRAALKNYARRTNNFLQVVKQVDALAQLEDTDNSTYNIEILKEAMGVAQHHDAVSGTEKQAVAYDYAERLANGVNECQKVVNDAYGKLLPLGTMKPPGQGFCTLLNISMCAATESQKEFQVFVYNPIGRSVTYTVHLPVVGSDYSITGPHGEAVMSEVYQISEDTFRIPERKGALAANELWFSVTVPALGFSTYFVSMNSAAESHVRPKKSFSVGADTTIGNQYISLTFDGNFGQLKSMKNLKKNLDISLGQSFMFYPGYAGNNSGDENQASGAYIFRPNATSPTNIGSSAQLSRNSYIREGKLVEEVYQQFSPWATQMIRVYENEQYAEFQWTIGPIPIDDKIGKEVITRYTTDLATQGLFYTDANGREVLRRQRNHRDTWDLNVTEPVSQNYYPVNSRIYMQDVSRNLQLTVLNDRSEGGGSLQDGALELMLHRRLIKDDARGVGEPMNETGADGKGLIVRGYHYVFLDTIADSARLHRDLGERLFMAPSLSFTNVKTKYSDWSKNFKTNWSGLKRELPANVHLLTLEQYAGSGPAPSTLQPYLLRLEHFYEKDEDATLSAPVTVSLKDLFVPFDIESVTELTLGSNLPLAQLNRLKWKTTDSGNKDTTLRFKPESHPEQAAAPLDITLNPMEIRTFQVKLRTTQH
ncbi:lysosomal alpha-mannosidase-like isoform X2 [Haliotis rufescens]|uniref:lysosomal alpha-mannosidase-like isoform X2 n=1 Tax=Haliotis rufescens TaxID=6454 RepID=UPI00201F25E4|nr:lysosomal alpha-mannosidase-like isoform X2 [Haliotis rufescens]